MKWVNRFVAAVLLAGTVPLWRQAEQFPGTTAAFPRVTLAVIAILALTMLAASFNRGYATNIERGEGRSGAAMLRAVSVFIVALTGTFSIPLIGFFPAMIAVAAVAYVPLGVSRPMLYSLSITLLLIVVYLIFVALLGVPLSNGTVW